MSSKELERIKILSWVIDGELSQILAGKKLGVSDRQVRNLLKQIRLEGDKGVISKKRGKPGNHCLDANIKKEILNLVREYYSDFGPTLASEYLQKQHGYTISKETLRLWMIDNLMWFPRKSKTNSHPSRARRGTFGEMTQIDGSHHHWFEERGPPCVLMVCIDDATSILTSLHFEITESLEAYYGVFEKHLRTYGIPLSIYGDRCSVLTPRNPTDNEDCTQFQHALKELGCRLILARSAQAKGRVERANRTLQDRLVKELRLKNISTIQEGNKLLEEFRIQFNRMFAKQPNEQGNAHRALDGISLEHVLTIRKVRTLTKDFTIQLNNMFYQISPQDDKTHLYKGGKVEIRQLRNKNMIALFQGRLVTMTPLSQVESPILDEKQVVEWKVHQCYIPTKMHPYRHRRYLTEMRKEAAYRYYG
jgi:transposase